MHQISSSRGILLRGCYKHNIRLFSTTMPALKKRAVAGSFIFKFPNNDISRQPQVALFKRSDAVRTYKNKYAPVSGSVEESDPTPLHTAWREIEEETGLTASSLRLFRQGKPYTFPDESIGREWSINPFSFILLPESEGGKGEAGINLDWEHQGYEWFDPKAVSDDESFGGVPKLLESFRRVWFNIDLGDEAGNTLSVGLKALQDDHVSGARQLASTGLDIFTDVLGQLDSSSKEIWWRNARLAAWHIWKNGRENMGAAILNTMVCSLNLVESKLPRGDALPRGFVAEICDLIAELNKERIAAGSNISQQLSNYLQSNFTKDTPIKILTLSSSSTIAISFIDLVKAKQIDVDLRILESRPLFEGVTMANRLSTVGKGECSSTITLYTDASAAIAAKDVDVVLIGADLIDKDGNVSNKTGSLPTVLASKHVSPSVKVVVLAEREKILPYEPPGHEDNDPREVSDSWNTSSQQMLNDSSIPMMAKNIYFEWVPKELIDLYVTEKGISKPDDIPNYAAMMKENANKFFDTI